MGKLERSMNKAVKWSCVVAMVLMSSAARTEVWPSRLIKAVIPVGIGSAVHISSEKFKLAAGIEDTHVPYRGGSEVITDILGGRIDFYFCPVATALPLIREGQVRALLVSTPKRVADLPDVPTPGEAGLKNAESAIWFGVFMPSKTPREIIEKFHAAGVKVLTEPAMQESLKKLGVDALPMK